MVAPTYFRIIGTSYPFMGASMVIAFAFQGLGRATAPMALMLIRVTGVVAVSIVCKVGDQLCQGSRFHPAPKGVGGRQSETEAARLLPALRIREDLRVPTALRR